VVWAPDLPKIFLALRYSVPRNRIEPPENSRVLRTRDQTTVEESWRHPEVGGGIRRRDLQLAREGEKACEKQRSDDSPISTLLSRSQSSSFCIRDGGQDKIRWRSCVVFTRRVVWSGLTCAVGWSMLVGRVNSVVR
jgi:hypothetical protein